MKSNKASPYKIPLILLSILLAITIGALIAIWAIFGTAESSEAKYETTNFAMGTYVNQTLYGGDTSTQIAAAAAANQAVADLDTLISWREDDSDIQKLNNHAGNRAVSMDPATVEVLQLALEIAEKTDGAYDPTILPLSLLWNFDEDTRTVPTGKDLKTYLQYVDYKQLEVDEEASTATLHKKHTAVDLGAIGKGAGCDAAIAAYADSGISHGIIAVGGSVGVYGTKPDGSKWMIGIRNPNSGDDINATMATLSIDRGFVSTSGTYEKTFQQDGVMYHHILDPKTGFPSDTDLVSVTVHCDNGALSDALSTACILLGVEKAQALLESYDAGAVFITKENKVIVTDNLKDCVEITNSDFTLQA